MLTRSQFAKNKDIVTEPDSPTCGLRVFMMDFFTDSRWDRFVAEHPDGLIYQHSAWLRALEAEYGRKCVSLACEDSSGKVMGILPLFYTRGLPFNLGNHHTGRRLSSLPRTPIAGPLFTEAKAAVALIQAAMHLASEDENTTLEIKTQTRSPDQIAQEVVCKLWRPSYVLNLQHGPRVNKSRNQIRIKWAVNKASKMGVQVRFANAEGDLRPWYKLYLHTMRRNAVPPRPYRFFASLWKLLQLTCPQNSHG